MNASSFIFIISLAVEIYVWLIIARVLLSFIRPRNYHPVFRFIYEVTEPVLAPCRRILPTTMNLDFSPLIAIIILELVRTLLINLVRTLL